MAHEPRPSLPMEAGSDISESPEINSPTSHERRMHHYADSVSLPSPPAVHSLQSPDRSPPSLYNFAPNTSASRRGRPPPMDTRLDVPGPPLIISVSGPPHDRIMPQYADSVPLSPPPAVRNQQIPERPPPNPYNFAPNVNASPYPVARRRRPRGPPLRDPPLIRPGPATVLKAVPSQIYLQVLLRLPSVYLSLVTNILDDSGLTLYEMTEMAFETAFYHQGRRNALQPESMKRVRPAYKRLEVSWNELVDSFLRDWTTYNIVSTLLLSAVLTILQIKSAAEDPFVRYSLLFSQICALISLLHGCLFIIRFDGSMRKTYKIIESQRDALRTDRNRWWSIWFFLAMPAIWLAWAVIFYIIAIMAFVWRTNSQDAASPPPPLAGWGLLLVRGLISLVLALGAVTGGLSLRIFYKYGSKMDRDLAAQFIDYDKACYDLYDARTSSKKILPLDDGKYTVSRRTTAGNYT